MYGSKTNRTTESWSITETLQYFYFCILTIQHSGFVHLDWPLHVYPARHGLDSRFTNQHSYADVEPKSKCYFVSPSVQVYCLLSSSPHPHASWSPNHPSSSCATSPSTSPQHPCWVVPVYLF